MYQVLSDISKINIGAWDQFISHHPDGHFFQSSTAYHFFESVKNYTPVVVCCFDNSNKMVGVMLHVVQKEHNGIAGKFTSRSICWGGPIVENKDQRIVELLLAEYEKIIYGKAIYTQVRNMFDCSYMADAFEQKDYEYLEHLNFHVLTENRETTLKSMSESKLRQIKKSLKSGASIVEATTISEVETFYSIIKSLYKEKVKKPLPDKSFFTNFFEQCCKQGSGKYLLIKFDNKIIGGIMCSITPGKAIYEWYIAGDDVKYKQLYPSIVATYAAIDYGLQNGLNHFDFMGAGKPEQDYGVREFKSKFGGDLKNFGRFEKVHNKTLMAVGKLGLKLIKHLK